MHVHKHFPASCPLFFIFSSFPLTYKEAHKPLQRLNQPSRNHNDSPPHNQNTFRSLLYLLDPLLASPHSSTPCVLHPPRFLMLLRHSSPNLIVLSSYHLPPAAVGRGQEDVSSVSFCAGRYRSLWWQKPSPSLWSSP